MPISPTPIQKKTSNGNLLLCKNTYMNTNKIDKIKINNSEYDIGSGLNIVKLEPDATFQEAYDHLNNGNLVLFDFSQYYTYDDQFMQYYLISDTFTIGSGEIVFKSHTCKPGNSELAVYAIQSTIVLFILESLDSTFLDIVGSSNAVSITSSIDFGGNNPIIYKLDKDMPYAIKGLSLSGLIKSPQDPELADEDYVVDLRTLKEALGIGIKTGSHTVSLYLSDTYGSPIKTCTPYESYFEESSEGGSGYIRFFKQIIWLERDVSSSTNIFSGDARMLRTEVMGDTRYRPIKVIDVLNGDIVGYCKFGQFGSSGVTMAIFPEDGVTLLKDHPYLLTTEFSAGNS